MCFGITTGSFNEKSLNRTTKKTPTSEKLKKAKKSKKAISKSRSRRSEVFDGEESSSKSTSRHRRDCFANHFARNVIPEFDVNEENVRRMKNKNKKRLKDAERRKSEWYIDRDGENR